MGALAPCEYTYENTHNRSMKRPRSNNLRSIIIIKGELHPWALFLKTLCIFSKNKATLDKVSCGSGQKCSKELKNHSRTSVKAIVVKFQ